MKSSILRPSFRWQLSMLLIPALCGGVKGELIAGVDFEGAAPSEFDRNPDDLNPEDEITVSTGTDGAADQFDGWTFSRTNGGFVGNGLLRNDNGANAAGATSPDFPARLEGNTNGSWSIVIPAGATLNLDRIEFDVRGATGGTGRGGQFRTSLDPEEEYLWENLNLPGRDTGNWQRIVVDLTGARYQGLTDTEVAFIWTTPGGAIDLDTIEVYSAAGGSGAPVLSIVPTEGTSGAFDFEWTSSDGTLYDLVSSESLDEPVANWEVYGVFSDLAGTGETSRLEGVIVPDSRRFFAIVEK